LTVTQLGERALKQIFLPKTTLLNLAAALLTNTRGRPSYWAKI